MANPGSAALLDSARACAARGWSVIPMQPLGKRPRLARRGFQQRITGANENAQWLQRWPEANLGVVTGRMSGIGEDARNNTIASFSGHLLRHGVDVDGVAELMLAWHRSHCCPPLPDAEVLHVKDSIARRHEAEGPLPG